MSTDYVGVPDPRLVYVLIADREKFDKIALDVTDHGRKPSGHVLTKSCEQDGVRIVFQHWLTVIPDERVVTT